MHSLFWKQEMELTLVGLQAAGKTTLLNVISDGKAKNTIPTVGLNIKKITKGTLAVHTTRSSPPFPLIPPPPP